MMEGAGSLFGEAGVDAAVVTVGLTLLLVALDEPSGICRAVGLSLPLQGVSAWSMKRRNG